MKVKISNSLALIGLIISFFGTILTISDEIPVFRNVYDRYCPFWRNINSGLAALETTETLPEQFLGRGNPGFDQLLSVINSKIDISSDKAPARGITNRREVFIKLLGKDIPVLSLIFLDHGNNSYTVVSTDQMLNSWIEAIRKQTFLFYGFLLLATGFFVTSLAHLVFKKEFSRRARRRPGTKTFQLVVGCVLYISIAIILYSMLRKLGFAMQDYVQYFSVITLGLAALIASPIMRWLDRPELEIRFQKTKPFGLKGPQFFPEEVVSEAVYYNFQVINFGASSASRCECVIEDIHEQLDNKWQKFGNFQPNNLKWAGDKSKDDYASIPFSEVGLFCTLINITKASEGLPEGQSAHMHFHFVHPTWPDQKIELEAHKLYRIRIDVIAENARQVTSFFTIKWAGVWPQSDDDIWRVVEIEHTPA